MLLLAALQGLIAVVIFPLSIYNTKIAIGWYPQSAEIAR